MALINFPKNPIGGEIFYSNYNKYVYNFDKKRWTPTKTDDNEIPRFVLDFENQSLSANVNFSRSSLATYIDKTGAVSNAGHNLLSFSEQFDNAVWVKNGLRDFGSGSIANTTATLDPIGGNTADKLVENTAASGVHGITQSYTMASNTVVTMSCYIKAAERNWCRLSINTASGSNASAYFNLSTGTVGSIGGGTASISSVGNGWYRCSVTGTLSTANPTLLIYLATNDSVQSYTGDGTSGIYIWGAQLEVGSTATEYKSTTRKNLLGYTESFENAAWTKWNSFVQTNLLTYSEDFSNAAIWGSVGATITANNTIAPNGYQTADRMNGSGSSQVYILRDLTLTSGVTYTLSVYAKANTTNFIQLLGASFLFGTNVWGNFDLVNGVTGSSGSSTTRHSITPVGNGWYRCEISGVASASGTGAGYAVSNIENATAGRIPTNTNATSTFIWGAQIVQGSVAGDYRRTDAAALPIFYPNHNGVVCAEKVVENTANNSHVISATQNTTVNTPYTVSIYAKAGERSWIAIGTIGLGATGYSFFNLATGTKGTTLPQHTSSITAMGNGWYRCSITALAVYTGISVFIGGCSGDNIDSYTGDGTSGIYIFGAQLSDSASLTPYSPVIGAAASSTAYHAPRFDYDGFYQVTNYIINSNTVATQSVPVYIKDYTLSYEGSGSITLSGAAYDVLINNGIYQV